MKQLLKKIAAIGTSALIVGISAGAAVATNYPNPFISGDVAVVYGAGADSLDSVQAYNINFDLTSRGGTSDSGSSVVGDAWQVITGSDALEMGESIKDIENYIGKDELSILTDGTIINSKGTATYKQYLYFEDTTSSMVNYTEDDDDNVGDFFLIESGKVIARYVIDFTNSLDTDVASNLLDDVEDETISMLGKTYTITSAVNSSSNQLSLTLMSGAYSATIASGEELTVGPYKVSAAVIGSNEVRFTIDGKTIDKMGVGEIEPITDTNDYIAVTDIDYESFSGGLHQATFWVGADKIILKNGSSMEVNGESISDAAVTMTYTNTDDISITEISINMTAEDDLFVPVNGKLSTATDLAKPGVLVSQNWDIEFKGYESVDTEELKISSTNSDEKYEISFLNYNGDEITLPLIAGNATGLYPGKDADSRFVMAPGRQNITKKDYFILNTADPVTASNNARTYVVQYKSADKVTNTNPKLTLDIVGVGTQEIDMATSITGVSTLATLKIGGTSFTFTNASSCHASDCDLSLTSTDFGDSDAGSANSNITRSQYLRTKYNALINITDTNWSLEEFAISTAAASIFGPINATWIINVSIDDTARDGDDLTLPETSDITITFGNGSASNPDITTGVIHPGATWITDPENSDVSTFRTRYGVYIESTDSSSAPAQIVATIPKEIVKPLVYISSGEIAVSTGSTGGATIGNVVYKDSEKASWSGKNVIIVGGSCINTATAEALGIAAGACGSAFTDATGVESGQFLIQSVADKFTTGKIALVVAGYNVDDTVAGATYLTTQTVNTDAGTKYKGTSSTSATLVVE